MYSMGLQNTQLIIRVRTDIDGDAQGYVHLKSVESQFYECLAMQNGKTSVTLTCEGIAPWCFAPLWPVFALSDQTRVLGKAKNYDAT